MPQSVTIELPLVIEGEAGHWLVRPVGFSEFAIASGNLNQAIRNAKRRVLKLCRKYVGGDLVARLVRGEVSSQQVTVQFLPPKKSKHWREPFCIPFSTFVWSQGTALIVTYVPVLDLTVVASPGTDVAKLVDEQIRSAVRRRGGWTVAGLMDFAMLGQSELRTDQLKVTLPTPAELARQSVDQPKSKTPTLTAVATRLKRKSLSPAYHRDKQVDQMADLLSGDNPRSILLVGPSGVGKTAVFHQWVRTRNRWDMQHVQCWSTDGSRLISGQCGFGMWQKQCLSMADEAAKYPSVVHLGNLVELSESGRNRGSGGCGSLLAPRLADGSLLGVVECTPEQLTRIERVEPRLIASLTQLSIEEPTSEEVRWILLEAAAAWRPVDITAELKRKRRRRQKRAEAKLRGSDSSGLTVPKIESSTKRSRKKSLPSPAPLPIVDPEALQVLDRLHRRFQTDAAAPGRPLAFFRAVMSEIRAGETLDAAQIIASFGRQTGLPPFLIDDRERPNLTEIRQQLASQVLGQDEVIETLIDVIATLAADLSRGDRPLASLMMIGPTGVGKTETAKALARLIYSDVSRLVRIDMSELSSPMSVGRLIGDSTHAEGLLTSAVRAQPFSLVLLDEFEKAHRSVFDLLLQVLGEGRLTDGRGRVADFRNCIVMMTSNLGVESFRAMPLGLADTNQEQRYHDHFKKQVRDFLRPEMFNRIDRILSYAPLSSQTIRRIAEMQLGDVQRLDGWKSQGNQFAFTAAVTEFLSGQGYQPQFGARPLQREIGRNVLVPLSRAICDHGRNRRIDVELDVSEKENGEKRVVIDARAAQKPGDGQEDDLDRLIDTVTSLRRRGQALQRCSAVTRLRNRYTSARRSVRRELAREKDRDKRNAIRQGIRASHCRDLRRRISAVEKLTRDSARGESALLCRVSADAPIDFQSIRQSSGQLKERLWEMLCELQSEGQIRHQRATLVLMGPKLELAESLLLGYQRVAQTQQWKLQVHALLPRDEGGAKDRVIDAPGWSSEPSFRINAEPSSVQFSDMLNQSADDMLREFDLETEALVGNIAELEVAVQGRSKSKRPALAAYGLIKQSQIASLPKGTLAVMMTFGGQAAEMMMVGEVGVHTFNGLDRKNSQHQSILVQRHLGTPIQYRAPSWLAERKFELTGHPRRGYDLKQGLVVELTKDDSRSLKMDRKGSWLAKVLEEEMERRIWATLDNDEVIEHDDVWGDLEIPF